jgi:hypothetical protein
MVGSSARATQGGNEIVNEREQRVVEKACQSNILWDQLREEDR